jgi:hypothetical protein
VESLVDCQVTAANLSSAMQVPPIDEENASHQDAILAIFVYQPSSSIMNREPHGWHYRIGPCDAMTCMSGDMDIAAKLKPERFGITFEN